MTLQNFIQIDLPPLLTGTLSALACALLGNFLVLRRQSLMGDAISHAVLPGLAAGFLLSGSRESGPMFLGALAAGTLTALLIDLVRRFGRVEPGAAMGVVFSGMFALGVVLITLAARSVDLDADCVLNGQLEDVGWHADAARAVAAPTDLSSLLSLAALAAAPRELVTVGLVTLLVIGAMLVFAKELRLSSFDPELSSALGFGSGVINTGLMALVATATVASFEAVGSILVIAMLICPAATARLLTDRLRTQIWLSAAAALLTGVGGYLLGAFAPLWAGAEHSLSVSGTMTLVAGALLVAAVFASPRHGLVARRARLLRLRGAVAREDLLAMLYRLEENGGPRLGRSQAAAALGGGLAPRLAIRSARRRGLARAEPAGLALTDEGRKAARALVRTHRLWEVYLVNELGLRPDHVHRTAETLEHHTPASLRDQLECAPHTPDPHGRPIP